MLRPGRQFSAWRGLTRRTNNSGGRKRQAGITKQGDGYLRRLLVVGAMAVIRSTRKSQPTRGWIARLLERKRPKVAAVALVNKIARVVWAMLVQSETYRAETA
jgi:transposase